MKPQHTPGRYKIVHTGKPYPEKDCKDKWSCIHIPDQFSFDIIFPEAATPEQIRKITNESAAAPELLEALEHTANYMRSLYGGHDGANEVDIYRIVVSTIAKAKGE